MGSEGFSRNKNYYFFASSCSMFVHVVQVMHDDLRAQLDAAVKQNSTWVAAHALRNVL